MFCSGGGVYTRWVDLHVIAEKIIVCPYVHVVKIAYPQDES